MMLPSAAGTPTYPRRLLPLLAAALAATTAVALAACTAEQADPLPSAGTAAPAAPPSASTPSPPAPTATGSTAPTPSPSPSVRLKDIGRPTAKLPPMPKGATAATADGLKLAAAYYFDTLIDHAYLTGETKPFADVCAPNVEYCASIIGDAKEKHQQGYYIKSGAATFEDATVVAPKGDATRYHLEAVMRVAGGVATSYGGQKIEEYPSFSHHIRASFVFRNGKWRVWTYEYEPIEEKKPTSKK